MTPDGFFDSVITCDDRGLLVDEGKFKVVVLLFLYYLVMILTKAILIVDVNEMFVLGNSKVDV